MSTDRDATRIVRSWLKVEEYESADRVLDAVFSQLPATPQRRAGWLARRSPFMSNTIRIAVAAAAVVLVVFLGYQFLSGPNVGGPIPTETPSPIPSPTTASAAFPPSGSLAIGRHPMTLAGVRLTIEFPSAGWISNGEWGIDRGSIGASDSASFILWPASAPDNVFADPCARTLLSPPPGSSTSELAAAVAAVPGVNLVSGPSEVSVGGYPAQHVVLTVPETIGCAATSFYLWEDLDNPGNNRYATQVGETFFVWIIDVDGTTVWIDGETFSASGPDAAQEVQEIVDSIVFE